ncbi:alpha/beta-hydrolase [Panus rudis PR-1116 ss-1]|nr:alpha/beta-hydrolase [Panus rudis PR-1116 ss-1]
MLSLSVFIASIALGFAAAQGVNDPQRAGSSWPHDYPGKPSGDFSPEWQDYFEVKGPLPNVTFPISRSFAGNIGVNRPGHPNDTLFFWGFEKQNGSLTNANNTAPWGIWLNGGPGSSSMLGLLFENGPIHVNGDYSVSGNNFSWNVLADYFWIDQPVGTGWATADLEGYAQDEDELGRDFWGFADNLVKVFPNLKSRPLYLTGESYAGRYIPYITKTYFGLQNPPVKIAKIAIGDGSLGSDQVATELPTVAVLETFPQLISYNQEVLAYFKKQEDLCGYNLTLTYPQKGGHFPTLNAPIAPMFQQSSSRLARSRFLFNRFSRRALTSGEEKRSEEDAALLAKREEQRLEWKRDLSGRANGTIDPFYGCALWEEMIEYALNFSLPWSLSNYTENGDISAINVYYIPDALNPETPLDGTVFLNNNRTRAAIHAPTSKNWVPSINYPFALSVASPYPLSVIDIHCRSMAFLSELATNTSKHNIPIVFYSGNDDSLDSHRVNMTFGGIQGFTRKPSTPWYDDDGNVAGIVHQERGLTFLIFSRAGHQVPLYQPAQALTFLREYILGNNQTGLVVGSGPTATVVGGENPTIFANNIIPGQDGIYVGSVFTASTVFYPAATIAAWRKFADSALPTP